MYVFTSDWGFRARIFREEKTQNNIALKKLEDSSGQRGFTGRNGSCRNWRLRTDISCQPSVTRRKLESLYTAKE